MARKTFKKDAGLRALKAAAPGTYEDAWYAYAPNLMVRVGPKTKSGKVRKTFCVVARFNGAKNPTRRKLGEYPAMSLEEAAKKAETWNKFIAQGRDPAIEEEKERRAELRKTAETFDTAVEDYIKRVLIGPDPDNPLQRRGHHVARELRREFADRWKGRPLSSIERQDVIEAIDDTLDRGATYQAHNLLGHVRSFYNWAIETGRYGLEHSPCDRIRPKRLIGERKPRQRVLDDRELIAFWNATEKMGYPFGPLYRLLLLTGARKREIGDARWREIDMEAKRLTVPEERFKSEAEHLVRLPDGAMTIIEALPRFDRGDYLFSTRFGERPVSSYAKSKARLDRFMKEELADSWKHFRLHDVRRTVRTRLAGLGVPDTVAEMVIGHGRKGIERVYDQHKYEEQMRDALDLWARKLRDLVTPAPDNVVALKAESDA